MKKLLLILGAALAAAVLTIGCDGCCSPAFADSATEPTVIKYGVLVVGDDDPNGDGSDADATSGTVKVRLASGATSEINAQVLYQGLTASTAHTGATAAETTKMPATDEGTGDTSLADWLLTGAGFDYDVFVRFTGDADGDETLTVKVYFGAVEVGSSGAVAVDGNGEIKLEGQVFISAGGATGTGDYSFVSWAASTPTMDGADIGSTDFTAANAFAIKLDWGGTTDAADSATVETARLIVNNFD